MTFLHPQFLWALTLASLPVIIHLLNLRRYKTVYFSNTRLLENLEQEQKRRTRLKDILVLLLRTLAIIMLVLAFAMPVKKSAQSTACSGKVVFYIDNSLSMTTTGSNGPNIETAKNTAFDILKTYPFDTEFMILTNELESDQQLFYDQSTAINRLARISPSAQSRSLQEILNKIDNLTIKDSSCEIPVFILSDFQKSTVDLSKINFPKNLQIYLIDLKPASTGNISIDTAWFDAPHHPSQREDSIYFVIDNRWKQDISDLDVKLYIDDTLKASLKTDIKAYSSKTGKFKFFNGDNGWHSGKIVIQDRPVTFDDTMYFAYMAKNKFKVLVINKDTPNKYLNAFYSSEYFDLTNSNQKNIPYGDFEKYNTIIINEADISSSGFVSSLQQYVNNGGSVVLIPSAQSNVDYLNIFASAFGAGEFEKPDTTTASFDKIDQKDEIFNNAIKSLGSKTLLPKVKLRFRKKTNYAKETNLISADDGFPLLSKVNYGKGKVYFFTFPLDRQITDFVVNPLFVPVFFNIPVFSGQNTATYIEEGKNTMIKIPGIQSEYLTLEGKGKTFIPVVYDKGAYSLIDLGYISVPAGIYQLKQNDSLAGIIAVNYNRRESDLSCFSPKELDKAIKLLNAKNVRILSDNPQKISASVKSEIDNNFIWKIFLILAVLFLILEMLVIRLIP